MKMSKRLAAFWALNLSPLPSVLAASTCSQLSGSIYTGYNGNGFDILCDTSTVNGNIFAYYSEGEQFQDCVDRCDVVPSCIVALYLDGSGDCALINNYQGTRSFSGNDIAIKRAVESSTSASSEATSTEATTSEAATSSEAATTEATSTEATSTEGTSTEGTTSEPATTSEAAKSTAATTATTNSFSTGTASIETSTDDCDDETSSLETLATVTTSTVTGSEIQSTILSTDSHISSITTNQPSEVSTSALPATSTISSQSSLTTTPNQTSTSTSLPSSVTSQAGSSPPASSRATVTQTYTTYSQVASSSGSSSSDTTEVGSKTLSTSGATIIKTTSESHLPTSYPTTDSVWTVYLTLVKYVACTTGVVAETVTTATYVTVDSNGGSYGPPVVTMPDGCIGGYQVDASGHSYPIAQPTKGSHVNSPDGENSQPSVRPTLGSPGNSPSGYETGQLHIPTPAAESQGNSQPEQGNKQPSVAGQGSSKPNNSEPQPTQGDATQTAISAYQSGTLVNPLLSSSIRQGQQGISTTFATEASVTEEMQAPKSTHNHLSEAEEAPSAPVTISGANRHQCMVWTLVAGAFLGLGMLF
ncbi:hypothetical protein ACJA88_010412 [Fusarium oxysporum]